MDTDGYRYAMPTASFGYYRGPSICQGNNEFAQGQGPIIYSEPIDWVLLYYIVGIGFIALAVLILVGELG